jgi:phosphoribosylglycinamide formyltransferase 1
MCADPAKDEMRRRVAVLASGRGSNLQALLDAIARGEVAAIVVLVVSDRPRAYALERAAAVGIEAAVVRRRDYADREAHDQAIAARIEAAGAHFVCLAGYMRLLSAPFVARFHHRIVNIHPSLLPSFPGTHAHRDVLAHGAKVSGCTVHFVDEGMDSGPIIAQAAVPVLDTDDEDALAARVLAQEHQVYPRALGWLVDGRVRVEGRHVRVTDG